MEEKDDGSLAFLGLQPTDQDKYFGDKKVNQEDLVNREFWVLDYIGGMKTNHGTGRGLMKIRFNLNDDPSTDVKMFTNSFRIKEIMEKIKEMNAFPRRVTLVRMGKTFTVK